MSSAFSALVLRRLMLSLNSDLLQRQRQANRPQTILNSYMDDTQPFLDYPDLLWYLQQFQLRGEPDGLQLNFIKTKIFSSITGNSPNLPPQARAHLDAALQYLRSHGNPNPELVNGTRVLGFPVGSQAFADDFLNAAADSFETATNLLSTRLHDTQTQSTLFRACAQASLTHLLPADVYYHSSPTTHSDRWTSTFMTRIRTISNRFIRGLTRQTTDLSSSSELIAYYPASLGGAGY